MPTAARLVAALLFAMVGFFTAEIYKPLYPFEAQWGIFTPVSAGIGLLSGWFVSGKHAGRGMRAAMGNGLRTSFVMVFFAMIIFSVEAMLGRSMMKLYDGIFQAILGTFDFVLQYGATLLHPEPLIVLIIGGMLAGAATEWAARRWS